LYFLISVCSAIKWPEGVDKGIFLFYPETMFIRKSLTHSKKNGTSYFTFRLVESRRTVQGVRQITLLNLGSHFSLPKEQWHALVLRIKDHLYGQDSLFPYNQELEEMASHYASCIVQSDQTLDSIEHNKDKEMKMIDINSLDMLRPRSIGGEHVALQTIQKLGLDKLLQGFGLTKHQYNGALGSLIGRVLAPGSELSTHAWLQKESGLGELLEYDFQQMSLTRMYQAADVLYKHKQTIEKHLYETEKKLFQFGDTITLYDLTNTYFEGTGARNVYAKRGHSKEKRSDCPLVTLALVLNGNGFPRKSKVYAGNVGEAQTLKEILSDLSSSHQSDNLLSKEDAKPTVICDAGIATEKNIQWLKEQKYHYIVVSRKKHRQFNEEDAVVVKKNRDYEVKIQRVHNEETGELELYCHSSRREEKDNAIMSRFEKAFEESLQKLHSGLKKKGCMKRYDRILEKIGRLKQKYSKVSQHYQIDIEKDEKTGHVCKLNWKKNIKANHKDNHPGVYCLRSSHKDWTELKLWKTYIMLTDLESVFKSLKSELGLRPVFHQKAGRTASHLLITLLAFHIVQTIRFQLKKEGIHTSWTGLRKHLNGHKRITMRMQTKEGETIHLRKPNEASPTQRTIYNILGISRYPGGRAKTYLKQK
jgi:hypothetical protein